MRSSPPAGGCGPKARYDEFMDPNQELPQSVADLDKLVAGQKQKKEASVFGYLILSLLVPPFTIIWVLYRAWQKGILHRLVPALTILYSILFGFFGLLLFSAPNSFSSVFGKNVTGGLDSILVWLTIFLTLAGTIGGFYLRNKANKEGSLPTVWVFVMLFILILRFLVGWRELSSISKLINQSIGNVYEGL